MGGFYGNISLRDLSHEINHDQNPYGKVLKSFSEESDVMADGFIYNLQNLQNRFALRSPEETIKQISKVDASSFPNSLKGEFTAIRISKKTIEISTNHTCSRRVFYTEYNGNVYFHWNLKKLQQKLESVGFKSTPNGTALRSLLSIGGVFGNLTVIENIHILRAGETLVVTENKYGLKRYYLPTNEGTSLSKKDFLNTLHNQFLNTVKEQYSHEDTLGFQLLSGGLDSRMNLSLAVQNGIQQESVLCFGQTGYRDHWISEQIAKKYNLKYGFVPLENGDYLKSIDENILAVDGLNFYASSAHFNYALDKTKYISPIIHTGQIGRTIFTEHPFGQWQNLSEYSALLCSAKFADSLNSEVKAEMNLYDDMDVFYLNNRLYRVISSGNFVAQKVGYIVSPFADPDIQNLAYSMPNEWKQTGRIQWEYLWKYHIEIMRFSQEEYGRPVRSYPEMFLGKVQNKLRNIYHTKITKRTDLLSMNPLEYWWEHNEGLRNYFQSYYDENIDRIEKDTELKEFTEKLYESSNLLEKTLALTVVGVMKNYFGE